MGTPVKIQSLAENLIRMSGLEPHKDIQIVYTGLRPGEKLYEERIMSEEPINETEIERVYTHTSHDAVNASAIEKMLEQMTTAVENHEARDKLISLIASIVPTYAK
jgi:FlaA1/EpsC-like NDP-sugar epimerase